MNLEQAIIELESCFSKITEVANSEVYQLAVKEGHPSLETNLEDAKHYLKNAIDNLEELLDIRFVESLDVDLSKCIPFTEEMQREALKLIEGVKLDDQ